MAESKSNIGPEWLDVASTNDICDLEVAQLVMLDSELTLQAAVLKNRRSRLNAALRSRYAPGTTFPGTAWKTDGSWSVRIETPKEVAWDQKLLEEAAEQAKEHGFNAWEVMKVELTLPEAVFKAMTPAIKTLFTPARTVKTGNSKITFHSGAQHSNGDVAADHPRGVRTAREITRDETGR